MGCRQRRYTIGGEKVKAVIVEITFDNVPDDSDAYEIFQFANAACDNYDYDLLNKIVGGDDLIAMATGYKDEG